MTSMMRQEVMSPAGGAFERELTIRTRHVCVSCRERHALFIVRGVVNADADHTLCFRCDRALRDRMRAS